MLFLSVVPFAWSTSYLQAQRDSVVYQQQAEQLFQQGVERYVAEDYRGALGDFQELVRGYPRSHRLTAAYIMSAKAQYSMGSYRESVRLLRSFFDIFPESSYLDDGHYTLGLNYYKLGRFEEAAGEFLSVMENTDESILADRSGEWLDDLATMSLSIGHLQLLVNDAKKDETKALLIVHLAEKIFRSGDADTAEELILPVTQMSPRLRAVGEALQLLDRIRKGGVLKVGVLLPLMNRSADPAEKAAGQELLEGARLAIEEYNRTSFPKISMEVRDTEFNPSIAATSMADLCTDDDIIAIVGPAHSEEAMMSATIANRRGVPMISPTATAPGIAGVGEFVFQANPDLAVRGRALAQFAMNQLGARTVAVLAPNDEISRAQVEAFLTEAMTYGADTVGVEWYEPGETNLRDQFMEIRRRALERKDRHFIDFTVRPRNADISHLLGWGIPQATIDTLIRQARMVPVDSLFGKGGKMIADSLRIPVFSEDLKLDSLNIPVDNLDVLFLPITGPEDIAVLSSQLRYFNFQSAILGSGEWNDIIELDQNRRYTNSIYFPSESYWREDDDAYRSFVGRYQAAYAKQPSRSAMFTYDTMKLLTKVLSEAVHERAKVAEALAAVRGYPGVHSKISFTDGRVNGVVTILQFKNRAVVRINEVDMATGQFWSGQD